MSLIIAQPSSHRDKNPMLVSQTIFLQHVEEFKILFCLSVFVLTVGELDNLTFYLEISSSFKFSTDFMSIKKSLGSSSNLSIIYQKIIKQH